MICFISIQNDLVSPETSAHIFRRRCFFFISLLSFALRRKQIGSIKRNRKHRIKRINFLFSHLFLVAKLLFYCWNILKLHDKCATSSLRCSLLFTFYSLSSFLLLFFFIWSIEKTSFFWTEFPFLCKKNSTRSDSSINYLFCVRSLFLFAYTPLKKTLKRNYSISYEKGGIWSRKREKKHGDQTEHLGRASNPKSVNQFWLSIISFWVDHTKQRNENAQNKFCVNLVWFYTMENYA